jgi:lysine 2,3-aminomutase
MSSQPFDSRRASAFRDIPDAQWADWHWQLSHRLNTAEEIERVFPLAAGEREALQAGNLFRVDITPYFISLIHPDDPQDPIRRQVIPTEAELIPYAAMMADSLAEDLHSPVPGLVHRYPDRVLMLVTTQCASYCRYCTRSRIVGDPAAQFSRADFEAMFAYIGRTPQIRDVLLSGGDPLTLAPKVLEELIARLRAIPHVEIIRIGTRVPVFLPMRVDDDLCAMLARYHPLWLNIHVNHPQEITAELAAATDRLARAGIPLGNQSVLLAGVNDCVHIQRRLVQDLLRIRVRPYYLYQCDLVEGAGHFRTPIAKGIEIIEGLRGHTSGFSVPQYVVDAPGGGGKIPLGPNYLLSESDHRVVLRNYEGYISTYEEPQAYAAHDPARCPFCRRKQAEPGQTGITGLLDGEGLAIAPEGFEVLHARGEARRRLNGGRKNRRPPGIGPEVGSAETGADRSADEGPDSRGQ